MVGRGFYRCGPDTWHWNHTQRYDALSTSETTSLPRLVRLGARVFRSHQSGLDGEAIHREYYNDLTAEAQAGCFRMNLHLKGTEPPLDDVKAIDRLRKQAEAFTDKPKIEQLKLALIASSFFFELDALPTFDGRGAYLCKGSIHVRGHAGNLLSLLRRMRPGRIVFATRDEHLSELCERKNICIQCGRF